MVQLSALILANPMVPSFDGSIEVDIIAEGLPSSDSRQQADLGKHT